MGDIELIQAPLPQQPGLFVRPQHKVFVVADRGGRGGDGLRHGDDSGFWPCVR